jgi:hypothetical protein
MPLRPCANHLLIGPPRLPPGSRNGWLQEWKYCSRQDYHPVARVSQSSFDCLPKFSLCMAYSRLLLQSERLRLHASRLL